MSNELTLGQIAPDQALDFITAGKAIFTLKSIKTQTRFTFRAECPSDVKPEAAEILFVKLLTGSNNETDYQYFGYLKKSGGQWFFNHGKKARITEDAPAAKAFSFCFVNIIKPRRASDLLEVWHDGRCGRCGRFLTDPESVEIGIGPECRRHQASAKK